jgi:hypothetical protein
MLGWDAYPPIPNLSSHPPPFHAHTQPHLPTCLAKLLPLTCVRGTRMRLPITPPSMIRALFFRNMTKSCMKHTATPNTTTTTTRNSRRRG